MASSGDIRDIMDLGHDGPRQAAPKKKKKKQLESQPRLSGISREVQALMGDSVPPVAFVETPKYKQKPSITMKMFKPRHWEERQFIHGARKDGLELRHWKRSIPGSTMLASVPANDTSEDIEMTDGNNESAAVSEMRFEDEFPSEKWNVDVQIKTYDDDQYEKFFKSEDWTKEETDYLVQLCKDFDLRWLLISDRYDPVDIPQPEGDETAKEATYPQRRMEDLKQRYYAIAAKMLELQTPASNMTQSEFQLWEKMRNFDARTEVQRKAMAEKLFERTKEEADEEKVLLEELYRITKNEDDFIKMRKELYSRLETAPSLRRNERGEEPSTALYQTSQGLSMLLSTLLAKEKRLKTRVAPNGQETPATAAASQTPVDTQRPRQTHQHSRRETMDSNAGDDHALPSKKASISQAPVVRTLSPAEEVRFGVSHPQERLTSGVMFRHEKIHRLTMAKSQVQTQKIGAALTELGIPPRLLMPTERVCREFERLVSEVQILLDTRRVLEKISSEVKVLEEQKRLRLGGPEGESEGKTEGADAMEIDNTAASAGQPDKTSTSGAARAGADAAGSEQPKPNGDSNDKVDEEDDVEDSTVIGKRNRDDAEIEDSQIQDENGRDEDDDDVDEEEEEENDNENDNEVDQSAIADDDEDADDGDQSYARAEEEEEEEEEDVDRGLEEDDDVNIDEDEEDEDDAPGLEDLERAHQVTDDEDEENEDDNEIDQSQLAEGEDEEQDVDEDEDEEDEEEEDEGGDDDQVEVDESMLNGVDDDEDRDSVDEENSRPHSSHSNIRAHKRSASAVSEASRTGSNRSGVGRKKRR